MRQSLDDLIGGRLMGERSVKISEGLSKVPREIFKLADTLEILDFSGNNISILPDDFARLSKLKILFLSDNDFTVFPKVLAQCPNLTMIGFKANKISLLPEHSLPKQTRWLILTDNQLTHLPESVGELAHLQKLMLAGNELQSLPTSIAKCLSLELIRISANRLSDFPYALLSLERLAWLAFSGNPFCMPFTSNTDLIEVSFNDVAQGEKLGTGASGIITQAIWVSAPPGIENPEIPIAVKTFKGAVTSDGYPQDELAASLAAGAHEGLIPILAKVTSNSKSGLAMRLISSSFVNLGQPPNFETCTRDVLLENRTYSPTQILNMTRNLSRIMVHLRERNICHGDLYAHNILVNKEGDILLSDFGAASHYATLSTLQAKALEAIEVRAFGCFLEDVLSLLSPEDRKVDLMLNLEKLSQECLQSSLNQRLLARDLYAIHESAQFVVDVK